MNMIPLIWDGKSNKIEYFIPSTAFCKSRVLQEKQINEGYKIYDADLKALDNYKYIPTENIKIITSSCAIHSTILRSTHSIYRNYIYLGEDKRAATCITNDYTSKPCELKYSTY